LDMTKFPKCCYFFLLAFLWVVNIGENIHIDWNLIQYQFPESDSTSSLWEIPDVATMSLIWSAFDFATSLVFSIYFLTGGEQCWDLCKDTLLCQSSLKQFLSSTFFIFYGTTSALSLLFIWITRGVSDSHEKFYISAVVFWIGRTGLLIWCCSHWQMIKFEPSSETNNQNASKVIRFFIPLTIGGIFLMDVISLSIVVYLVYRKEAELHFRTIGVLYFIIFYKGLLIRDLLLKVCWPTKNFFNTNIGREYTKDIPDGYLPIQ